MCGCLEKLTSKSAIFHTNIPATYVKACTKYADACVSLTGIVDQYVNMPLVRSRC